MTRYTSSRCKLRLVVGTGLLSAVAMTFLGGSPVSAHPLGNFSVNHLNQLRFTADKIIDDVVIDSAEIPTAQADSMVDGDGDGTASASELDEYGVARCDDVAAATQLSIDGTPLTLTVDSSTFSYEAGQAGLPTGRLECRLSAPVDLSTARSVAFSEDYLSDRVGWREITAVGDGVRLLDSPVPQDSLTDGLRSYPDELLSSPLDVRAVTLDVEPGVGVSTDSDETVPEETLADETVANDRSGGLARVEAGSLSGWVDRVQRTFDGLIGRRELTLGVGLLATGLALVLGASHALLPGHGKTVMAAYIAGRQGSVKDAAIVGATVTGTHTGGVLLLGLALTVSTSLAGETVLGYLGVSSGLLVAALGLALLIGAIRHRGTGVFGHGHTHAYDLGAGHSHAGHSHADGHGHSHADGHTHDHRLQYQLDAAVVAQAPVVGRGALARSAVVGGASSSSSVAVLDVTTLVTPEPVVGSQHHDHQHHDQHHHHDHHHEAPTRHVGRRGLIGMGIAGGLVPSPSALIILLSAIALGRTWFGILLVIGYGAGMAGTLTLAGVLLVKMRDRYRHRVTASSGRVREAARRWGVVAPYFTAALVLVVGLGLAIRSAGLV